MCSCSKLISQTTRNTWGLSLNLGVRSGAAAKQINNRWEHNSIIYEVFNVSGPQESPQLQRRVVKGPLHLSHLGLIELSSSY